MPRVQIYKLNPASVIVTEFVDLPGEILSSDRVDFEKPPIIPDDLQRLFSALSKDPQPTKLIVCEGSQAPKPHANQNGWSMCQSAPVTRRRLGDTKHTAFLAPT